MPQPAIPEPSGTGGVKSVRQQAPDLARLPVSLNFRAISIAEGLRAAFSVAAIVAANEWLQWPPMMEAAIGALLTSLCDAGGPIRRRVPWLLTFAVSGALITAGFGLLRQFPLALVIPIACAAIFLALFARIYSQQALQVGNLLTVAVVLALNHTADLPGAAVLAGAFLAGGIWALLLTMVIWQVHPYAPARRSVADAYRALARLVADLHGLVRHPAPDASAWDAHARAYRRAVRDAIEAARNTVMDTVRLRGPVTGRAGQSLIRVETADQIFGALLALTDHLETCTDAATLAAADRMLRRLRALLVVLADAAETDKAIRTARVGASIEAIAQDAAGLPAPLPGIAASIVERLRISATLATPENFLPGGPAGNSGRVPFSERILAPIRANLDWDSAALRHALRATVAAAPAFIITLGWPTRYSYWLTIMLVLTMQPVFALTWQRALERIAGTLAGGAIATALSIFLHTPLQIALALFPLLVIAMSLRLVSFALFMTGITPVVVLLSELGRPGTGELTIALMRALYVLGGSLLAVLSCLVLWPSWEPSRLRRQVTDAILAHAAYAEAELSALLGAVSLAQVEQARRAAGLASNNLESSVSRTLLEPGWAAPDRLEAAMVIDAGLRRFAGRIAALQHSPDIRAALDEASWRQWREWIGASLRSLAALHSGALAPRPAGAAPEALSRMARQIELMAGALGRVGD